MNTALEVTAMGLLGVCLILAAILHHVTAQVEVKQSSTVNGQTTKTTTSTSNESEEKISIQDKAKADLVLKPGELKIHYCNEDDHCHSYTLWANGTITEVK
jgi:hypothetical protein